jgi:hypothetical protein
MGMTLNGERELPPDSEQWVRNVSQLQESLNARLKTIGFLRDGEDDNISHHLAEVSITCSKISGQLVPELLNAEEAELGNICVDLFEDLREVKESIESLEHDLLMLMNHLNP